MPTDGLKPSNHATMASDPCGFRALMLLNPDVAVSSHEAVMVERDRLQRILDGVRSKTALDIVAEKMKAQDERDKACAQWTSAEDALSAMEGAYSAVVGERDALQVELDRVKAQEESTRETLANVGAPDRDDGPDEYELSANGMLIDWLAGRRKPGWTGSEGQVIDRLRSYAPEMQNPAMKTEDVPPSYTLLYHGYTLCLGSRDNEPLIVKTAVPWDELKQAIRYWRSQIPGCRLEVRRA